MNTASALTGHERTGSTPDRSCGVGADAVVLRARVAAWTQHRRRPRSVNGAPAANGAHVVVGDQLVYGFHVTNTGNVPLKNVAVDDAMVGTVTCPKADLVPGEAMDCTSSPYTVTAANQAAGSVKNTATAHGTAPNGAIVTSELSMAMNVVDGPVVPPATGGGNTGGNTGGSPSGGTGSTAPSKGLAYTGTEVAGLAGIGLGILLLGTALVTGSRRRRDDGQE